jgi:hypothetical protein
LPLHLQRGLWALAVKQMPPKSTSIKDLFMDASRS